ncbi:hypothetical protein BVX97_00875 [bacterium E08(2017)]|nr:hypothetical protein BVX97_00875 [bacterium E08(2017)]
MSVNLIAIENDLDEGMSYYCRIPGAGIYHRPDYLSYLQKHYYRDSTGHILIYEEGDMFIYYPFFKRPVIVNDNVSDYYDITSSWYYGGVLAGGGSSPDDRFIFAFDDVLQEMCLAEHIVAGFDRLDPNLENHHLYRNMNCELMENRQTVYVDLEQDESELWKGLHESRRRNIRKAQDRGVAVETTEDEGDWMQFWEIYNSEMLRKDSVDRLRFTKESFLDLRKDLSAGAKLLVARNSNVIGGFLMLHDGRIGHHFLSASMPEYWEHKVNDILFYSAVLSAKNLGCGTFDFQGGRHGVYEFKRKFSNERKTFYTIPRVYDSKQYDLIVNEAGNDANGYFPAYRVEG